MAQNKKNNKIARFKEFFIKVEPIKLEEPLGKTLGAFEGDGSIVETHVL